VADKQNTNGKGLQWQTNTATVKSKCFSFQPCTHKETQKCQIFGSCLHLFFRWHILWGDAF